MEESGQKFTSEGSHGRIRTKVHFGKITWKNPDKSSLRKDHMGESPQKFTSEGSHGRIPTKVQQKQAILLKEIREYSQKVYKVTIWEDPPKSISEAILLKEI